jgi:hypothetical protein
VVRRFHFFGSKRGTPPSCNTGHLSVATCPGGSRPSSRIRASRSFRSEGLEKIPIAGEYNKAACYDLSLLLCLVLTEAECPTSWRRLEAGVRIENWKSATLTLAAVALLMACVTGKRSVAAEQQPSPQSQTPGATAASPAPPAARPTDVGSIDAILHAAYDTISGPAGQKRDWSRFRSLFIPGARLIPVIPNPKGGVSTVVFSVDDYVARGDPYFQKNGFFEREIARKTELYGNMTQVFSTYESRHDASDAKPFERGINSFQLMNDGQRWWIVTIFWQGETSDSPIPKEYLPGVN